LRIADGLILPGGESTTQLQFLQEEGLYEAIKKFAAEDKAISARALARFAGHRSQKSTPRVAGSAGHDRVTQRLRRQVHSDVVSGPSTLKKTHSKWSSFAGQFLSVIGSGVNVLAEFAGNLPWCRRLISLPQRFTPNSPTTPPSINIFLSWLPKTPIAPR